MDKLDLEIRDRALNHSITMAMNYGANESDTALIVSRAQYFEDFLRGQVEGVRPWEAKGGSLRAIK